MIFAKKNTIVKVAILMIGMCVFLPSCHRSTLDEQCADMVKREKRRLPRNVAQGVVLDSLKYESKSRTLVYYYTMSDSLYSDEAIEEGKDQMQRNMLEEISNSIVARRLKDEGVSFKYIYLGDSKQERFSLMFNNKDFE